MTSMQNTEDMQNLQTLQHSLRAFASAPHTFHIPRTIPHPAPKPPRPPKSLYVLDSSFNPPTRAHLRICTSALLNDRPSDVPKRLLLLLATQNADKAPKPAAFEQRLAMMSVLAEELVMELSLGDGTKPPHEELVVDVGVTKEARFIDKAKVIEEQADYREGREPMEQIHLIGYDTLIRLLDTKYYAPDHTLRPLEGLFANHRVRVTRRTDDVWGGREEQDDYLRKIERGEREAEGGKREWIGRIELVEGRKEGEDVVSSTKVREAAKNRDDRALKRLVTDGVAQWILEKELYLNDG